MENVLTERDRVSKRGCRVSATCLDASWGSAGGTKNDLKALCEAEHDTLF